MGDHDIQLTQFTLDVGDNIDVRISDQPNKLKAGQKITFTGVMSTVSYLADGHPDSYYFNDKDQMLELNRLLSYDRKNYDRLHKYPDEYLDRLSIYAPDIAKKMYFDKYQLPDCEIDIYTPVTPEQIDNCKEYTENGYS